MLLQFNNLVGLKRNSANIEVAVERASKVLFALNNFARLDSKGIMQQFNNVEGIETILTLYRNQFKKSVKIFRNYELIPAIIGYPDEMNQVWTNMGQSHSHHHHPQNYCRAFAIGIVLNITFIIVEVIFGVIANSLALLADAGHNFSDVIGLVVVWGASWLSQ